MKFQHPGLLWLAVALAPLCLALMLRGQARRRASLDKVIALHLRESLLRSVNYGKRWLKQVLLLLAFLALVAALARPLAGHRLVKVERAGVDLMILFDLSRSMQAEDARWGESTESRINAAKKGAASMLQHMGGDRVGLVAFAGEAALIAPVTQDHYAIERTMEALSTTSMSKPGSDLAAAIKLAVRSLPQKQPAGRAILLLTDGEELQGDAVLAAREAARQGISLFTAGVGTSAGARGPDRGRGQIQLLKNEFGQEVMSRMNERVLRQIAAAGHGQYAPMGPRGEGLKQIVLDGFKPLAKGVYWRESQDFREFFQWPLAVGIVLLLWESLQSERRLRAQVSQ